MKEPRAETRRRRECSRSEIAFSAFSAALREIVFIWQCNDTGVGESVLLWALGIVDTEEAITQACHAKPQRMPVFLAPLREIENATVWRRGGSGRGFHR